MVLKSNQPNWPASRWLLPLPWFTRNISSGLPALAPLSLCLPAGLISKCQAKLCMCCTWQQRPVCLDVDAALPLEVLLCQAGAEGDCLPSLYPSAACSTVCARLWCSELELKSGCCFRSVLQHQHICGGGGGCCHWQMKPTYFRVTPRKGYGLPLLLPALLCSRHGR